MQNLPSIKWKYTYNGGEPDETWESSKKYEEEEWEISFIKNDKLISMTLHNFNQDFKETLSINEEQYERTVLNQDINEYLKIAYQLHLKKNKKG